MNSKHFLFYKTFTKNNWFVRYEHLCPLVAENPGAGKATCLFFCKNVFLVTSHSPLTGQNCVQEVGGNSSNGSRPCFTFQVHSSLFIYGLDRKTDSFNILVPYLFNNINIIYNSFLI